jgi:hypothetical protein
MAKGLPVEYRDHPSHIFVHESRYIFVDCVGNSPDLDQFADCLADTDGNDAQYEYGCKQTEWSGKHKCRTIAVEDPCTDNAANNYALPEQTALAVQTYNQNEFAPSFLAGKAGRELTKIWKAFSRCLLHQNVGQLLPLWWRYVKSESLHDKANFDLTEALAWHRPRLPF